jgi:hypothetical protein
MDQCDVCERSVSDDLIARDFDTDGQRICLGCHGAISPDDRTDCEARALEWMRSVRSMDEAAIDPESIEACFCAIYGREPTDEDRDQGLWLCCCEAVDDPPTDGRLGA